VSVSLRQLRSEPTWENGVEHSGSRWFADTEEVTGSNPVAPTTPLLSRAFVDSVVPQVARRPVMGRPQRQESTSLLNQGVHLVRAPEPVRGRLVPSSPTQTFTQRPRRQCWSGRRPRTDAVEALASRTQATGRARSGRVARANPGAGEVAEVSLPHLRVCWAAMGNSRATESL
jgi:hypothetical protein